MLSKSLFSLRRKQKKFFIRRYTARNVALWPVWKSAPAPIADVTMEQAFVHQHKLAFHPPGFRMHRFLRGCRDMWLGHFGS
jgi:hypothetical protein